MNRAKKPRHLRKCRQKPLGPAVVSLTGRVPKHIHRPRSPRMHQYDTATARSMGRSVIRANAGRWDGKSDPYRRLA